MKWNKRNDNLKYKNKINKNIFYLKYAKNIFMNKYCNQFKLNIIIFLTKYYSRMIYIYILTSNLPNLSVCHEIK